MKRAGLFAVWLALVAMPALASPRPSGSEILVGYPHETVVINPDQADDWGLLPVSGTVEAAAYLQDRHLLFLHMPDVRQLAVVDVTPFSTTRYQVLASYQSPELGRKGLQFVQSGTRIYLASGRTAVAIVDPQSLLAKLGLYSFDFLPLLDSQGDEAMLAGGVFTLKDGQLTVETPSNQEMGVHAPVFVRLSARPLQMLSDPVRSLLYLSASRPDGTGALLVVDAKTQQMTREVSVPWPITSLSWLDDGDLCLLSGPRRRLALYDPARDRFTRIWSSGPPGLPTRLLSAGAPAQASAPASSPMNEEGP